MVPGDWDAVGEAIAERMARRGMSQMQLAQESRVSQATIRELQYNNPQRRRHPQTLSAISEALGEPKNFLQNVLMGQEQDQEPQAKTLSLSEHQERLLERLLFILEHRLGPVVDTLHRDPQANIAIQIQPSPHNTENT